MANNEGFFSKMYHAFIMSTAEEVQDAVIYDVIVPNLKDTIRGVGNTVVDMLFGGKSGYRAGRYRDSSGYRRSYSNVYPREDDRDDPRGRIQERSSIKSSVVDIRRFDASDYVIKETKDLSDRGHAEDILITLEDQIAEYGTASIGDFLDLIGITPPPEAYNYGWNDLSVTRAVPCVGGYILTLPRPMVIKK